MDKVKLLLVELITFLMILHILYLQIQLRDILQKFQNLLLQQANKLELLQLHMLQYQMGFISVIIQELLLL